MPSSEAVQPKQAPCKQEILLQTVFARVDEKILSHFYSTYSGTFVVSRKFVHHGQIISQQFSVKTICKPELV